MIDPKRRLAGIFAHSGHGRRRISTSPEAEEAMAEQERTPQAARARRLAMAFCLSSTRGRALFEVLGSEFLNGDAAGASRIQRPVHAELAAAAEGKGEAHASCDD